MIGFVFLLTLYTHYVASTHCRPKWLMFYDSCYYFGPAKYTWEQAKKECEGLGCHLSSLQGQQEEAVLVHGLKYMNMSSAWLGGFVRQRYDYWTWLPDNYRITYENWGSRDPYNRRSIVSCLTLQADRAKLYSWVDETCDTRHGFICEGDLIYPPTS